MIISKSVTVTISNQGKYYSSLGYTNTKQGTKLIVDLEHLPLNSNTKVEVQCDDCGFKWKQTYQLMIKRDIHRCYSCNRKHIGKTMNCSNIINATKTRVGPKHPNWNPNKKAFTEYAYKVRRITEENYEKYKDIINPDDLLRTLCGVENGYQLDHKISIKWGFTHGVNPKVIGDANNLQMLSWNDNRTKHINI